MKKLILILLVGIALVSCKGKDPIIGTWHLESMTGWELTDEEKTFTWTFNEDGSFKMNGIEGREKKGTWSLTEDRKSLTMNDGTADEVVENLEINDTYFTYVMEGVKVRFDKVEE